MTSPLNREELREKFRHLFTSNESDLEYGLKLADQYAQQVALQARFDEIMRFRAAMCGDGVHNGDAMDYWFDRYHELETELEKEVV